MVNLFFLIPVLIRWLVIKFKYNGRTIDPATGEPRKLGGKWSSIIGYTIFGLAACLFLVAGVMSVIESAAIGWPGHVQDAEEIERNVSISEPS